ncbi:MAG: hypothetical protein ACFE7R_07790 [Candidatus Hodarchaeota archaeon]
MIQSSTQGGNTDISAEVLNLVERNVSSVEMMSSHLGVEQEETRRIIVELIEQGAISGRLSPNGERFYKSDARISEAPAIAPATEMIYERASSLQGISILISGFIMYLLGHFVVGGSIEGTLWYAFGASLVICGPLTVVAGLVMLSRLKTEKKIVEVHDQ